MADKRVALLKRANKLFRQGKAEAAVKEYKKILDIKPDDLEVRRIIGDLELRQNNIPGAIEQFDWIADHYLKEGFFAKAIAMYKRITRVDPGAEATMFKLADLYTKQGLVMEAKQIYLDVAEECKRQNNQKKALNMYKKILEFDRGNIKMRLLLADNYLKEGLENEAVNEYAIAADILISRKDFRRVEELLSNTIKKINHPKLIEKLTLFYTKEGEDEKAIELLKDLGLDAFQNIDLLKAMGELYLKKNMMEDAEIIFSKIAELDPEETEVIMRLGKVYMQREDYDKAYNLFLPLIDKNVAAKKYEEAASMLRFIIASNNSYLPALLKLAEMFKLTNKTNNLIALYESMIPVYEKKGMKEELRNILEELIQLSDTPFTYEELLAKLDGQSESEAQVEKGAKKSEEDQEFINYNLKQAEDALNLDDHPKAIDLLKKTKANFPKNAAVREKLFSIYQELEQIEAAVEEGKGLLKVYKSLDRTHEYADLLAKLSSLRPEDDNLVGLSHNEKTSIDIDFDRAELEEEIIDSELAESAGDASESDVLLLSHDESIVDSHVMADDKAASKSLSSVLSEVDFYLNDGYFGDAEKLIDDLREKYPDNHRLLEKIQKLEKAKQQSGGKISPPSSSATDFEIESSQVEGVEPLRKERTELLGDRDSMIYRGQDSQVDIDIGDLEGAPLESPPEFRLSDEDDMGMPPLEVDGQDNEPGDVLDLDHSMSHPSIAHLPPVTNPEDSSMLKISEEAYAATDGLPADDEMPTPPPPSHEMMGAPEPDFEIEIDEPEDIPEPPMERSDYGQPVQAPPAAPEAMESVDEDYSSSPLDELDLDSIIEGEEPVRQNESPFSEAPPGAELGFESDEDFLTGEEMFIPEAFLETETQVGQEKEAIAFWLKELEKQRTSTIEKNMMEIFEEFKKGVDEKIGKEDYDTRYNLGIAYKEMGLLEEAIHEFLISAKHPAKYFDSAGLLGMCFREKGMFGEAINWFEKALDTPNRRQEEYLAVKYEMVITLKQKEDYKATKKVLEDILRTVPNYRNAAQLYSEIKNLP